MQHWNFTSSDVERSSQFWYRPFESCGLSVPNTPISCYQLSKDLEGRVDCRRTLWRCFVTFYAGLLRRWCKGACPQTPLLTVVSALHHFNFGEEEARHVQRWAIEGERLLHVSDELKCPGWFLFLPEGITQTV